jgi:hypothetical protein
VVLLAAGALVTLRINPARRTAVAPPPAEGTG